MGQTFFSIFASWGIALIEYTAQVPANRIGYTVLTLPQLMRQPLKLDYLWAGLCMLGAVYFAFRSS